MTNSPRTIDDALYAEVQQLRRQVAELEGRLAQAEERRPLRADLRVVLDNTTDAIWAIDAQARLVYYNRVFQTRFEQVLGKPPLVGVPLPEQLSAGLARIWKPLLSRALAGESFSVEQTFELEGESRVYNIWFHPLVDQGRVTGATVYSRDVTAYKRTEEQLLEQTSMLQSILDNIGDGVVVVDQQGRFLVFNPAAERIIGLGPSELPPQAWPRRYGLFLPDMVTPYPADQLPLVRSMRGEVVDDALVFVRNEKNRQGAWLSVHGRPWIDKQGRLRGGVAALRDITASKEAAEALATEQQFLEQLLLAHERDRQLMAYEIHDGLVQEITAALLHLEAVAPASAEPGRDGGSFAVARKLLRDALDEGRRVISGLRPPILDELGIIAAIDYLVGEHAARGGAAIRFNHDVHFDRLEPLLEGTIFRITQEGLTNIRRHSRALTASVDLSQIGDRIQLQIRDTGVGFDPAKVDKRRFGLRGICERARLLRGRAVIESAPGKGTRIFVELPVYPRPNHGD